MDHVVVVVVRDDADLEEPTGSSGPMIMEKSGWSGTAMEATAFSNAWRMSSSEIPCLWALGRISTATTLVVVLRVGNGRDGLGTGSDQPGHIGSHGAAGGPDRSRVRRSRMPPWRAGPRRNALRHPEANRTGTDSASPQRAYIPMSSQSGTMPGSFSLQPLHRNRAHDASPVHCCAADCHVRAGMDRVGLAQGSPDNRR